MKRTMIAAVLATALPMTGHAEGFTTIDLGNEPNDAACVSHARSAFNDYKQEVRAGNIAAGKWTVALYDIYTDSYDAIITCNVGPRRQARATLVVYAADGTDRSLRRNIARRIKDIWRGRY